MSAQRSVGDGGSAHDGGAAGAESAPARRSPGRPRSAEAHQAILTATVELLAEQGLRGLSIEAVAARAGVGKTTIYRRWDSKDELVADAAAMVPPPHLPPDQGSLIGDLGAIAAVQQARLESTQLPRLLPRVLSDSADDPELHALIVERAVQPLRAMIGEVVRRAIERGELRPDLDVEATVDVLHALPVYRILIHGGDLQRALAPLPGLFALLIEGLGPR